MFSKALMLAIVLAVVLINASNGLHCTHRLEDNREEGGEGKSASASAHFLAKMAADGDDDGDSEDDDDDDSTECSSESHYCVRAACGGVDVRGCINPDFDSPQEMCKEVRAMCIRQGDVHPVCNYCQEDNCN